MYLTDPSSDRTRRANLRAALRRHQRGEATDRFDRAVHLAMRGDDTLSETDAIGVIATERPDLWTAAQREASILLNGIHPPGERGLTTAPPTDQYSCIHPSDWDDEELKHLAGDKSVGRAPRRKGSGDIRETDSTGTRKSITRFADDETDESPGAILVRRTRARLTKNGTPPDTASVPELYAALKAERAADPKLARRCDDEINGPEIGDDEMTE